MRSPLYLESDSAMRQLIGTALEWYSESASMGRRLLGTLNGEEISGYQRAYFWIPPWLVSEYRGLYIISIFYTASGQGQSIEIKNKCVYFKKAILL